MALNRMGVTVSKYLTPLASEKNEYCCRDSDGHSANHQKIFIPRISKVK